MNWTLAIFRIALISAILICSGNILFETPPERETNLFLVVTGTSILALGMTFINRTE
jgi:hypothetical protein